MSAAKIRPIAVLALVGALASGLTFAARPSVAESGADVVEACAPLTDVPELGPRTCKSVQAGLWLSAQTCRRVPGAADEVCPAVDGRRISEAAMDGYETGWLARALDLQRDLDRDVPLVQSLIPHTHNSANSAAYDPTVSTLDANQVLTITDQLRLGIRGIEIDVHWAPNPSGDPANGFREVVQCHGEPVDTPAGVAHAGCSVDRTLEQNLRELRAWLDQPSNADELVLLYLENVLDGDETAHARAVQVIEATLGDLVFRPTASAGCQPLPVTSQSKGSILATGARVLITGNCGPGGWTDWVFERGDAWDESGSTTDYECAADRADTDYDTTFVRRYEDSTWLSKMAGGGSHIAPEVMADMVRCGVNLPGLDQVYPGDPRLPSLVWSWAPDQPAAGATDGCAVQRADGRFVADDCESHHAVACRTAAGHWAVVTTEVPWAAAAGVCSRDGYFDTPHNGWDDAQLRAVADAAGAGELWLAYRQDATGRWVAA